MLFAVVKDEFCSCSCNFLSVRVENRAEKGQTSREWRENGHKKFWYAVVLLYV